MVIRRRRDQCLGLFGQFIFAPFVQALIHAFNWVTAILVLAVTLLSAILLAISLMEKKDAASRQAIPADGMTLAKQVRIAFKDHSYLCLHAWFFTCGFLVTHLPREIDLCGLPASISTTLIPIIGLTNYARQVLLSHQVDGFFWAWLGGVALYMNGDYSWMWYADIVLAIAVALVKLPIREEKPRPINSAMRA